MRLFAFFLFISFLSAEPEIKFQDNFDAKISIQKEDSLVSSGYLKYREGNFFYDIQLPYSQKIIGMDQYIIVQDDDFNQVHVYEDNSTFLLREVFNDTYKREFMDCLTICFKIILNEGTGFQEAFIVTLNKSIDYITATDIQNMNYLIKFENFKTESSKIVYEPPEDYVIVNND